MDLQSNYALKFNRSTKTHVNVQLRLNNFIYYIFPIGNMLWLKIPTKLTKKTYYFRLLKNNLPNNFFNQIVVVLGHAALFKIEMLPQDYIQTDRKLTKRNRQSVIHYKSRSLKLATLIWKTLLIEWFDQVEIWSEYNIELCVSTLY